MNIYQSILEAKQQGEKLLAVLIDPEKMEINQVESFIQKVNDSIATHIFVGGSTDKNERISLLVDEIKSYTTLPIVLFPGSSKQIAKNADAILFLSLISGRNPEYLIDHQIASAIEIHQSNLEVIPTGYILIDGGRETSVQKVTQTDPIPSNGYGKIMKTALAGQLSGKKLIYLEAGSGAVHPVSSVAIQCVNSELNIPIIVGGGIRTKQQMDNAYNAGADLVVIGTAFEEDATFFNKLKKESIHESFH